MTADDIILEARSWLDTPFHAQAHCKGVGADCVGLLRGVAEAFGVVDQGRVAYPMRPDGTLQAELERRLRRVPQAGPGDVLMMSFGGAPHHVALYTGETLIHAHVRARRVVEQPMTEYWWGLVRGVYCWRDWLQGSAKGSR